jgi:hypothetical protein
MPALACLSAGEEMEPLGYLILFAAIIATSGIAIAVGLVVDWLVFGRR